MFDTIDFMFTGGPSSTTQPSANPWSEDATAVVTSALAIIANVLAELPPKVALQLLEFCRRRIDAIEATILAGRYEAGASDSDVADLIRSESNASRADAKKRASRGKATNANPDIADRMAEGTLSSEQADVIASAAEDTDGAAACDKDLLDEVAATTPEQGKKKARAFVNDRTKADDVQTEHDTQRRRRTVYRYRTKDGDYVIAFQGDKTSIDQIERKVNAQADLEYQNDGDRDVPPHKHPRTYDQRRFDAAHKVMCGEGDGPAPSKGSAPPSNSASAHPASPTPAAQSPTSRDSQRTNSQGSDTRRSGTIIVTVTTDQLNGVDDSVITTADGTPLPRNIVESIACGADFIGQIYSAAGELLWQGRKVRLATPAQVTGLIARDGGCVQCGAHYSRCEAHHLDPFEAPIQGETNIDKLALLCGGCHHDLHDRKRTLYYDRRSKSWKTRAARWEEIPPQSKPRFDEQRRNRYRGRNQPSPVSKQNRLV